MRILRLLDPNSNSQMLQEPNRMRKIKMTKGAVIHQQKIYIAQTQKKQETKGLQCWKHGHYDQLYCWLVPDIIVVYLYKKKPTTGTQITKRHIHLIAILFYLYFTWTNTAVVLPTEVFPSLKVIKILQRTHLEVFTSTTWLMVLLKFQ